MYFRAMIQQQPDQLATCLGALDRVRQRCVTAAIMRVDPVVGRRAAPLKQLTHALEIPHLDRIVKGCGSFRRFAQFPGNGGRLTGCEPLITFLS